MAEVTKVSLDKRGNRMNVRDGGRVVVPVTTGSTAANASNFGFTTFGSTAGAATFELDAPEPGVVKYLYCTAAGSTQTVLVSTGGAVTIGASTKNFRIKFGAAGQSLILVGRTTTKWDDFAASSTAIAFST